MMQWYRCGKTVTKKPLKKESYEKKLYPKKKRTIKEKKPYYAFGFLVGEY